MPGFPPPWPIDLPGRDNLNCEGQYQAEAVDFTGVLEAFAFAKNRPPGYNKPYYFDPLSCLARDCS
jgi:hypothetical protein